MNLSKVAKRAFLSITAVFALVLCLTLGAGTAHAAVVVDKTISAAGGSITFSYTTQASITNLSSKPAWLSVSSRMNSASSVTYTITASANPNCNSRSFDLCFSGTNETYRITQYGLGHNYSVYEKTNPTCTSYGHECFKCSRCESRTQGNQLPMVAHNSNGYQKQVATYTADGFERTYCTVCKKEMSRTKLPRLKVHVVFDPQNGSSSTSKDQYASDKITGFPSVSRTGYTLKGWYTKTSGGTQYTSSSTVPAQSTLTLYAQWSAKTIVVTLDANGGNKVDPNQNGILFGNKYGTMPTPTRTGYTFDGWYTAKSGGSKVTSTTVITNGSNHTLYAHWTAKKFTVSFDSKGGSAVASRTVTYDSTYGTSSNQLTNPTRDGYTFQGWYTAASGGTKISYTTKVTITSNQTLYAHWSAKTIVVTLDANGGDKVDPNQNGIPFGNKYGTMPTPKRTGYTFDGWFTAKSGGSKVTSSTTITNSSNHTLYAHWTANKYNVYFNNGTTTEKGTVTYGNTYGALSKPTKTGYTLVGWYTKESGGDPITSSTVVKITADQTLYAHWKANEYKVTFDPQGGSDVASRTVKYDGTYGSSNNQLTNPTYPGSAYTFAGWYKEKTWENNVTYKSKVTTAKDHTLYARWKIEVSFNVNGGSGTVPKQTYYKGSTYGSLPAAPTAPTGYEFAGWYNMASGGSQIKTDSQVVGTYKTLYAHWNAKDIKVTFDYCKESGAKDTVTLKHNGKYDNCPTNPTREHYKFIGWYKYEKGVNGGVKVDLTKTVTFTEDVTLYAHWMYDYIKLEACGDTYAKTFTIKDFPLNQYRWKYYFVSSKTSNVEIDCPSWLSGGISLDPSTNVMSILPYSSNSSGNNKWTLLFVYDEYSAKAVYYKIVQPTLEIHTVHYFANKGTNAPADTGYVETTSLSQQITDDIPDREGYEFVAWNTKPDGSGIWLTKREGFDSHYWPDGDVGLYAIWRPKKIDISMSINDNGEIDGKGYTYPVDAVLFPGETIRVELDIPKEYYGGYKLEIGENNGEDVVFGIEDETDQAVVGCEKKEFYRNKNGMLYFDSGRGVLTTYYNIQPLDVHDKEVTHFIIIRNGSKSIQRANALLKSERYYTAGLNSKTSVVWKRDSMDMYATAGSSYEQTWEVYLCPRDVSRYLTLYNMYANLEMDNKNFVAYLRKHLNDAQPPIMDILGLVPGLEIPIPVITHALSSIEECKDFLSSKDMSDHWLSSEAYAYDGQEVDKNKYTAQIDIDMYKKDGTLYIKTKRTENGSSLVEEKPYEGEYGQILESYVDNNGALHLSFDQITVNYGVHFTMRVPMASGLNATVITDNMKLDAWDGKTDEMRPGTVMVINERYSLGKDMFFDDTVSSDMSWVQACNYLDHPRVIAVPNVGTQDQFYFSNSEFTESPSETLEEYFLSLPLEVARKVWREWCAIKEHNFELIYQYFGGGE